MLAFLTAVTPVFLTGVFGIITVMINNRNKVAKENNDILSSIKNEVLPSIANRLDTVEENMTDVSQRLDDLKRQVDGNSHTLKITADNIRTTERYRLDVDLREAIKRGKRTAEETQRLTSLFEGYKQLDGNGYVDALYKKFSELEME